MFQMSPQSLAELDLDYLVNFDSVECKAYF